MKLIPTNRIESFSDGVIAIIITIMVFDLKVPEISAEKSAWLALSALIPKACSYLISFSMIAIMWVNHHQLFHQIKNTDRTLLWCSIHLLFWMSLVPFSTNFVGTYPFVWQSAFVYGLNFFMCALSFNLLRGYITRSNLLLETISHQGHQKIRQKNKLTLTLFAAGAILSLVSVYISFILFVIVPAMYFIPERIITSQHEVD